MEEDKKCPQCGGKHIAFEWYEDSFDMVTKCQARVFRNKCMDCQQIFNEKHIPSYQFKIGDTMEEKYLCITCKHQQDFFAMYCSVTDKECPVFCTECEHYDKEKQ